MTAKGIQTRTHLHELLRFILFPVWSDETCALRAWGLKAELGSYWHEAQGFACDRHHGELSWSTDPATETQMPVFKSTAGNSGEGGDKLLPESERDTFSYLLSCVKINKSIKQTEKILQFLLSGVRCGNKCRKPQAGLKGECVRDAGREGE